VTVRVEAPALDALEVRFYDLTGALVHEAAGVPAPAVGPGGRTIFERRWDVGGAASGTYYYVVTAVKGGETRRVARKLAVVR
jgi:hypothetical protein